MLKLSFVLCASSTIWACGDGQAEDDYLGEPLLTAQGSVVSSEVALTRELVLSLEFTEDGLPATLDAYHVLHYLKAEVAGSFPSAFTMRIYDPPPREVVIAAVPGEPAFATGSLVTVRADHPEWLRWQFLYGGPASILHTCAEDGECRDVDLGVPECLPLRSYGPCPGEAKTDDTWSTYGRSSEYEFVYFAEATPAGSFTSRYFAGGNPIGKGYHLLVRDRSAWDDATREAVNECSKRAEERATAAVNTRHGREPGVQFAFIDPVALRDELPGERIIARVEEGCSTPGDTWVDDPATVSLALALYDWSKEVP